MTKAKPFAYCILCQKTFKTPTEALDHFRERRHGWSTEWKHGFDGRKAEEKKRKKDGRRTEIKRETK